MNQNQSQAPVKSQQTHQHKILAQKNKLIQQLQQKNSLLLKQVQRITKIVQQYDQKTTQYVKNKDIKPTIVKTTYDPQILQKQLQNCYKQIKLYEFQVDKLKSKTISNELSDNLVTMDRQLKQRKSIQDRLKQQLNSLNKEISQNAKRLSGNGHQQDLQKQFKGKSDELKFLKEMIKVYEQKDQIKQKNLKTEYSQIKKMEKQFFESGGDVHQIQIIKQKTLSQFQQGRLVKREQRNQNDDQKVNKIKFVTSSNPSILQQNSSVNIIAQERTRSNFQSLSNELNVLLKLNKKYEKQFQESNKSISQIQNKCQLTKLRLERVEKQIQEVNGSIKLKKTLISAENMKPTYRKSVLSVSVRKDISNIPEAKETNRRKRNIINMTAVYSDRQQRLYHN